MKVKWFLLIFFVILLVFSSFSYGTASATHSLVTPESLAFREVASQLLKVHFIDVGQGDSILLDFGQAEILIDGGDGSPPSGLPTVSDYISSYVDGNLEVIVATHPHADHIGGLIAVLQQYVVEEVWLNSETYTTTTYTDFMNAVNSEGAIIREVERGQYLEVGALTFRVLNPARPLAIDDDHVNNNSIVLQLSCGEIDFLFTGDIESEAESGMLSLVADIDILKVAHHGSRYSSSAEFLGLAMPEVVVIMVGDGNNYGHPHQETLTALHNIGATVKRTDIDGNILVTTDGISYWVGTSSSQTIKVLKIGTTGNGITSPLAGQHLLPAGMPLDITANPGPGWQFSQWSGDAISFTTTISIVMDNDKSITANFIPQGTVTINNVIRNPGGYNGKVVKLWGAYRGWESGHGTPPVSRSDWVLQDLTGSLYITGNSMGLLYPRDVGKVVAVTGTVRLKNGQPYIKVTRWGF